MIDYIVLFIRKGHLHFSVSAISKVLQIFGQFLGRTVFSSLGYLPRSQMIAVSFFPFLFLLFSFALFCFDRGGLRKGSSSCLELTMQTRDAPASAY